MGPATDLRVATLIDRGAHPARGRIRGNLRRVDVNDDELVKTLADDAFEREGYGWDLV